MTSRQILSGEETKWNRSRTRDVHKSPNQSERLQERAYKYAHWFNPNDGIGEPEPSTFEAGGKPDA